MKNGRAASLLVSNLKYTSRKTSKRRKSKSPKIGFKVEKSSNFSNNFDWYLKPLRRPVVKIFDRKAKKKKDMLNNSDLPYIKSKLLNFNSHNSPSKSYKLEAKFKKIQALRDKKAIMKNSFKFFKEISKRSDSEEKKKKLKKLKPKIKKYEKLGYFIEAQRSKTEPVIQEKEDVANRKKEEKIKNSQSSEKRRERITKITNPLITIRKMSIEKKVKKSHEISMPLNPIINTKKKIESLSPSPEIEKIKKILQEEKMKFTKTRDFYTDKYRKSGRKAKNRDFFLKLKNSCSKKKKKRTVESKEKITENNHENSESEKESVIKNLEFDSTSFYHIKKNYDKKSNREFHYENFSYMAKMIGDKDRSLGKLRNGIMLQSWDELNH